MKELNVRILDLETKAYANASRLKGEALRSQRTGDKSSSGSRTPLPENERTRTRLEEEVKSYEAKIASMREAMSELVIGDLLFLALRQMLMSSYVAKQGRQSTNCET